MRDICNLCGVNFQPAPQPFILGHALDWRCEIRAVDRQHGYNDTWLTGVGVFDDGRIIAPRDPALSYREAVSLDDLERYVINYCLDSWTFAFHEACWELLLNRLRGLLPDSCWQDIRQVAHYLFNLLHCLPSDCQFTPIPAYDLCGAGSFDLSNVPETWSFLWAEPRVPCFSPTLPVHHRGFEKPTVPSDLGSVRQYSRDGDIFSRLPLEIIWIILSNLASSDVSSSRLSSRTLAALATHGRLPQSFWCSRFNVDNELGFLYTEIPSSIHGVDWEDLYRVVKAELRNTSESGYLRNGCRIWRNLCHITDCLVVLLEQKLALLPHGTLNPQLIAQGYDLGEISRGHARYDGDVVSRQLSVGSRLLGENHILFSLHAIEDPTTFEIRVSFLNFNCTTYICGLRYLRQDSSCGATEISRVGLITPRSEKALEVSPGEYVSGLRVATTVSGIKGIAFIVCHIQNKSERILSAGLVQDLPQGVGQATLRPTSGKKLVGAVIGFDACKFVSIQLIERWSEASQVATSATGQCNSQSLLVNLYNSRRPHDICSTLVDLETSSTPQPYLFTDMQFGGVDGASLPLLFRVVAYHDDLDDDIRGFAFHYVGGKSVAYGETSIIESATRRWNCVEQSVSIDGPSGERITKVEYVLSNGGPSYRVKAVKMFTNWARDLTFSSYPSSSEGKTWVHAQNPKDSPSTVLTGIVAKTQLSTGYIRTLATYGIVEYQEAPLPQLEAREITLPADHSFMNKAPRSHSVKCCTTASLDNIKRVSISGGEPGKTRSKNHISSLRLDFFHSKIPVFAGQWFEEIGSLEFEPGDRITGFTFWQTQETKPNIAASLRENAGKIAGISITKTGSFEPEKLEICLQDKLDLLNYSFDENKFEDLSGLVWAFNHELDYIQTVTRPPASKHGMSLILYDMLDIWPNSRFPGKLFWEVTSDQNESLPVSAIYVVFQETSLVGFMFEYEDGKIRRSAGCTIGETHSMVLQEGEVPCRIDIATWGAEDAIIFHTNQGQKKAFSSTKSRQPPLERPTEDFDVYMLKSSADDENQIVPGQEDGAVDKREQQRVCVGIWVTMRIIDRSHTAVEAVGPILINIDS